MPREAGCAERHIRYCHGDSFWWYDCSQSASSSTQRLRASLGLPQWHSHDHCTHQETCAKKKDKEHDVPTGVRKRINKKGEAVYQIKKADKMQSFKTLVEAVEVLNQQWFAAFVRWSDDDLSYIGLTYSLRWLWHGHLSIWGIWCKQYACMLDQCFHYQRFLFVQSSPTTPNIINIEFVCYSCLAGLQLDSLYKS